MTIRAYLRDGFGASIEGDLDWIGAGIKKLGCQQRTHGYY